MMLITNGQYTIFAIQCISLSLNYNFHFLLLKPVIMWLPPMGQLDGIFLQSECSNKNGMFILIYKNNQWIIFKLITINDVTTYLKIIFFLEFYNSQLNEEDVKEIIGVTEER